jgi:hypothetical protein
MMPMLINMMHQLEIQYIMLSVPQIFLLLTFFSNHLLHFLMKTQNAFANELHENEQLNFCNISVKRADSVRKLLSNQQRSFGNLPAIIQPIIPVMLHILDSKIYLGDLLRLLCVIQLFVKRFQVFFKIIRVEKIFIFSVIHGNHLRLV